MDKRFRRGSIASWGMQDEVEPNGTIQLMNDRHEAVLVFVIDFRPTKIRLL